MVGQFVTNGLIELLCDDTAVKAIYIVIYLIWCYSKINFSGNRIKLFYLFTSFPVDTFLGEFGNNPNGRFMINKIIINNCLSL